MNKIEKGFNVEEIYEELNSLRRYIIYLYDFNNNTVNDSLYNILKIILLI